MEELRISFCKPGGCNVYILHNGSRSIIIDTGTSGKSGKIIRCLEENDLHTNDIELIILTHTHYDHAGSVAELKERLGAKVMVGDAEANSLEKGNTPLPRGMNFFSDTIVKLGKIFNIGSFKPVKADYIVKEEFSLKEFGIDGNVIPTPGHTGGSLTIVINNQRALVGDAMFHVFKNSIIPFFANYPKDLYESWKKLASMDVQTFYPGHGPPISKELLNKDLPVLEKKLN